MRTLPSTSYVLAEGGAVSERERQTSDYEELTKSDAGCGQAAGPSLPDPLGAHALQTCPASAPSWLFCGTLSLFF